MIVANAKIEHIVEAIRTQLPSREDLSAQVCESLAAPRTLSAAAMVKAINACHPRVCLLLTGGAVTLSLREGAVRAILNLRCCAVRRKKRGG